MAKIPASESELTTVFIDESSQTAHRYLALGALALNNIVVRKLEARLREARLPELPAGEMGWTKVSNAKLEAYKRFVDVFFDSGTAAHPLEFHSLVVDTHNLKDALYNGGSREVGFNKELYQLCMKVARRLYPDRMFHIYPDQRTTKSRPEELRDILNHGLNRSGDDRDWPFRRIHFRNSAESLPMQLADILLGSVTFRLNGHYDAAGASPAKRTLADHIADRSAVRDVARSTAIRGKFTVWHRQLR